MLNDQHFAHIQTQRITKNKKGVSFLLEIHSFLSVNVLVDAAKCIMTTSIPLTSTSKI